VTAAWYSAAVIAGLLAVSAVWPGLWCARFCPLGASQDLLAYLSKGIRRAFGKGGASTSREPGRGLPRRLVLGSLVGLGWAAAARALHAKSPRCLRPPGALEEADFVGLCIRCGNCTRVCPAEIISPDQGDHGLAGLLAPVIEFREDYCREDCTLCSDVCPSGALRPIDVRDKPTATIGLARVDMSVCLLSEPRECAACRNHCPFEAIEYVWSEIDYALEPKVDAAKCPGCGACEVACPTTPAKAIVVYPG